MRVERGHGLRYLIDAYNLMHAAAGMGGPLSGMTVRRLCQYLAASPAGVKATLVLDGRAKPEEPSANEFPDIDLVYSGVGVTADMVIGQMVERSGERKKITVVSNDRAVVLHARRLFAQAMSCEAFLRKLTEQARASGHELPANKVSGTATTGEAEHWMKEFGLETDDPNPQPLAEKEETRVEDLDIEGLLGPRGE
jgi:predicted RNA-binding protein with PIN domain